MKKNLIIIFITSVIISFSLNIVISSAQSALPDIIVAEVNSVPETPLLNENFTLNVIVHNQGGYLDRGFYITIRNNDDLSFIKQDYIAGTINSGDTRTLSILITNPENLGFTEIKNYHLKISADNSIDGSNNNLIQESNEENNSFIRILSIVESIDEISYTAPTDSKENNNGIDTESDIISDETILNESDIPGSDTEDLSDNETILYNISAETNQNSATISWDQPRIISEFDGYALFFSDEPFNGNITLNLDPILLTNIENNYTFSDLEINKTYYTKIYTYKKYSETSREYNNESESFSFSLEEFDKISNFTGTSQYNSVSLHWNAPSNNSSDYFALYYKKSENFTDADFVISLSPVFIPVNIQSYTFYDLDFNTKYFFKVYTANVLSDNTVETLLPSDIISVETGNSPSNFSDLAGHWAESYVQELLNLGVIQGYSDGTFKPNNNITRAELIKVALKANEIFPEADYSNERCNGPEGQIRCQELFRDLLDWQEDWVYKAKDLGIITGYNANEFGPNNPVTRTEALKIIIETFTPDYPSPTFMQTPNFTDIENHWGLGYIKIAGYLELVQGYNDNTFKPNNPITRAEAIKIISLLLD